MYVFLINNPQITADNKSILKQLLLKHPETMMFTGAGYLGYLSETKKDIVSPFFYKKYKNKKPYPCKFFRYEVPEEGIIKLKSRTAYFVYHYKYDNSEIDVKNFIGYIDKEYINFSYFFLKRDEYSMILSGVSELIYNELIPNKERFI